MKTNKTQIVRKIFIIVFIIVYLIPLYVALVNAFKPYDQIIKKPLSLPASLNFDNFIAAFESTDIFPLYLNSIIITVGSLAILILISSMLAYVVARNSNRKFYKFIFIFIIAGMMVPPQMVLVPSIKTLKFLGLLHTLPGMFFFYAGTYISIGFFLYYQFIKTVPMSLEEAATIEAV